MRKSLLLILGAFLAVTPASLLAQRTTGSITGTVKDATGGAMAGVTVTVSGPNIVGTQTAGTSEHGFYRLINLPPRGYPLSLRRGGVAGRHPPLKRGRLQLRPERGGERPDPPLQLLRPGGGGTRLPPGRRQHDHGRHLRRPHHGLRLLLRRELLPR